MTRSIGSHSDETKRSRFLTLFERIDRLKNSCKSESTCESEITSQTPQAQGLSFLLKSNLFIREVHGSSNPCFKAYRGCEYASPQLDLSLIRNSPLSDKELELYKTFAGRWSIDHTLSDDIQGFYAFLEIQPRGDRRRTSILKVSVTKNYMRLQMDVQGLGVVDEKRPWTGADIGCARRDLRPGGARCWMERFPRYLLFRQSI